MTKLLQRAFEEVSELPESEQDALGRILLEELASERRRAAATAAETKENKAI